jgi:hypothetical protein
MTAKTGAPRDLRLAKEATVKTTGAADIQTKNVKDVS